MLQISDGGSVEIKRIMTWYEFSSSSVDSDIARNWGMWLLCMRNPDTCGASVCRNSETSVRMLRIGWTF